MAKLLYIQWLIFLLGTASLQSQPLSISKQLQGQVFIPNTVNGNTVNYPLVFSSLNETMLQISCSGGTPRNRASNTGAIALDIVTEAKVLLDFAFTLTAEFEVNTADLNGAIGAPATQKLIVSYDPAAGSRFVEEAIRQFPEIYGFEAKVKSVTLSPGLTSAQKDKVAQVVKAKMWFRSDQFCQLDFDVCQNNPSQAVSISYTPPPSGKDNGYMRASWPPLEGAVAYQLEWTYVDDYIDPATGAQSSAVYDFRFNAARVEIPETYYDIPLLFNKGQVLIRVRGVGRNSQAPDRPVYTPWIPCNEPETDSYHNYPVNAQETVDRGP